MNIHREYKGEKLRRDMNQWFTTRFFNVVGLFGCDDPQTKVDLINNFKQRASMSIVQRV